MITHVDEELRHNDLRRWSRRSRSSARHSRTSAMSPERAPVQTGGRPGRAGGRGRQVRRQAQGPRRRRARDAPGCATPRSASQTNDEPRRSGDRFTKLKPGELIVDEKIYRELRAGFGEYFTGAMGAEAIKKRSRTSTSTPRPSRCARSSAPARARRSCARSSDSRSSRRSSSRATSRWAWSSTRFR